MNEIFKKNRFKERDSQQINTVLFVCEKVEKEKILEKLKKLFKPFQRNINFIEITKEKTHHSVIEKGDLFLSFSRNANKTLEQYLLENGTPSLALKGLFKDCAETSEFHSILSEEKLYKKIQECLLDESGHLCLLSNISRNLHLKKKEKEKETTLSFSHVLNPPPRRITSDLYSALPLVYKSFKIAKENSREQKITHFKCSFENEEDTIFENFKETEALKRSVLDLKKFKSKRKLPLLSDILENLYKSSSDGDYLIYTNADIILLPHFYERLSNLISEGHDGIIVNRRTLSKKFSNTDEMGSIYSEIGSTHPGFDCFVFKRNLFEKFYLGQSCLGVHLAGRSLFYNLFCFCKNLIVVKDEHLTAHIGDDNSSKSIEQLDYIRHNTLEAITVLETLDKKHNIHAKLKQEENKEKLGNNILKFNFAPGRFIQKSYKDGKTLPQNSLEKSLIIHSKTKEEADFLITALSLSKKTLQEKARFRKNLSTLSQKSKELGSAFWQTQNNFTNNKMTIFFKKAEDLIHYLESSRGKLTLSIEEHRKEERKLSKNPYCYSFDCSQSNLIEISFFESFTNQVEQILFTEGVKSIIHLIYKEDHTANLKEALKDSFHISLFENKASDLIIDPIKIKEDLFYQKRIAFELLCLNKTVLFPEP